MVSFGITEVGGCSVEPVNFTQRTWLCIVARLFARLFGLPGSLGCPALRVARQ